MAEYTVLDQTPLFSYIFKIFGHYPFIIFVNNKYKISKAALAGLLCNIGVMLYSQHKIQLDDPPTKKPPLNSKDMIGIHSITIINRIVTLAFIIILLTLIMQRNKFAILNKHIRSVDVSLKVLRHQIEHKSKRGYSVLLWMLNFFIVLIVLWVKAVMSMVENATGEVASIYNIVFVTVLLSYVFLASFHFMLAAYATKLRFDSLKELLEKF
jgi:hypothetical protein